MKQDKATTPQNPPSKVEKLTLSQDGETLVFEVNSASCMKDYLNSEESDEIETFFDWCKKSYPYSSIPVKEGQDELQMTGPHFMGGSAYFQIMPGMISVTFFSKNKQGSENNKYPWYEDEDVEKARAKAESICTAVNNTYGQNINPESVPAMYRALKLILSKSENNWQWTEYDYNLWKLNVKSILEKATPNK